MKKKHALITGASEGIGFCLAQEFAKQGYSLVLVARTLSKLNDAGAYLQNTYKVDVQIIQQDLLEDEAAINIYKQVKNAGIKINVLINNAGFNEMGHFVNTSLKNEIGLVKLHVSSAIELTKLFVPDMVSDQYGRIVFLGSTGSFMPVPNNAVYCAAKAFILNFSKAIRHELKRTGVKVTTLCPGATSTNFPVEAEMNDLRLFNIFPMKPERVAQIAYKKIAKGAKTIIPGLYNKLLVKSSAVTPAPILNSVTDWMYQPA